MRLTPITAVSLITLLACVHQGCDGPPPGRVASPPFVSDGLFGSMRVTSKAKVSDSKKKTAAAWGEAVEEEEQMLGEQPVSTQSVSVGGRFMSVLPAEDWEVANVGSSTFIVHTPPGGEPDAFVYARAFTPLMAKKPVIQTRSFVQGVDPTHDVQGSFGGIGLQVLTHFMGAGGLDMDEMGQCLASLSSPAGSHGLGFRTNFKRSHGVRWLGESDDGLFYRLARLEGRWSKEPIKVDCDKALSQLTSLVATQVQAQVPGQMGTELAVAIDDYAQEMVAPKAGSTSMSAQAVVGTVSSSENETAGIHLAVVCVAEPKCVEAESLTRFVEEMHIPSAEERSMAAAPDEVATALNQLAARVGVTFDLNAAGLDSVTKALHAMQEKMEKAATDAMSSGALDDEAGSSVSADETEPSGEPSEPLDNEPKPAESDQP
jgi:hypothetical protein